MRTEDTEYNPSGLNAAAKRILDARRCVAFTGAGISVESGIPPFRGPEGLWEKYDPSFLDIQVFKRNPGKSWILIKEIFYDFFGRARPNAAHHVLAALEAKKLLHAVITQNIDNLHQEAGSRNVIEFHGTSRILSCLGCGGKREVLSVSLEKLPPVCPLCGGVLRPDFVFFGEPIPESANRLSWRETAADVWIVVGTSGEVMPASLLPIHAKQSGAFIIEINTEASMFTSSITDVFLKGKASVVLNALLKTVESMTSDDAPFQVREA